MKYYLGPYTQQTDGAITFFGAPAGAVGCIDLAPLPLQSQMADHRPVGIFWTSGALLPSEYALVGYGDCRELATTSAMQDAFKTLVGYKPQGARLADLVMDCLQGGSDPTGNSGPLPIVPTQSGWMDLWMPGHSKVLAERFEWGKPGSRGSNHTPKLKQLLRLIFAQLFADAQAGKLKDNQHHRRVLDAWCDEFNLQGADDWKEFVPANLQKDVPGRLKHETTITDDFNRANSTGLGTAAGGWSWTGVALNLNISSNAAVAQTNGVDNSARAETDLSSANHVVSVDVAYPITDPMQGPCSRFGLSNQTFYVGGARPNVGSDILFKVSAGTFTSIGTQSHAISTPATVTTSVQSNGSTQTLTVASTQTVVTDTAIASGLRTGLYMQTTGGPTMDNFSASDLSSSILYTQLENTTRGLRRGTFARGAS